MKIQVLFYPSNATNALFDNQTVVVIDILRAGNSILECLENGVEKIIPVSDPNEAIQLGKQYSRQNVLLSGERNGIKIPGFDLGNSPYEFTADNVQGKIIIMSSTNGTKTIRSAENARRVYIGSFRNLDSLVNELLKIQSDLFLLCSGKFGQFALEDAVYAGALIEHLSGRMNDPLELSDSAIAGRVLYQQYQNDILGMLKQCEHGRYLVQLGFAKDLEFCARLNQTNRIPIYHQGIIR